MSSTFAPNPLHLDIVLKSLSLVGMHDAHESGLAKIARWPTISCQFSNIFKLIKRELYFRRKAVVHANQRRGTSAAAAPDVVFLDHDNSSGLSLRKVEGNRRSHDARAQNHDVGGI